MRFLNPGHERIPLRGLLDDSFWGKPAATLIKQPFGIPDQQQCEWVILKEGPVSPFNPQMMQPNWHIDYDLKRDPKPEPPR